MSGWWSTRLRKAWRVRTKKRSGRRGGHGRRAPGRLPDERDLAEEVAGAEPVRISSPSLDTTTSPSTMTKNSWPMSPSRASTLPSSTSRSSVTFASSTSSAAREALEERRATERGRLVVVREELHVRNLQLRRARCLLPARSAAARPRRDGSCRAFQSSPSSATVRCSPSGHEDRVVAESLGAARLRRRSRPASVPVPRSSSQLRREAHELGDVARAAAVARDAGELLEQPRDVLLVGRVRPRVAGRADPGPPAEPVDLEPRVLADRPAVGRIDGAPERRLRARVLVEGLAQSPRAAPRRAVGSISQPGRSTASSRALCAFFETKAWLVTPSSGPRARPRARRGPRRGAPRPARAGRRARRAAGAGLARPRTATRLTRTRRSSITASGSAIECSRARSISSCRPARREAAEGRRPLEPAERPEADEHDARGDQRRRVVAGAGRHADRGDDPEARRRREPADGQALPDDRAGAQEADAR